MVNPAVSLLSVVSDLAVTLSLLLLSVLGVHTSGQNITIAPLYTAFSNPTLDVYRQSAMKERRAIRL
jgi:hypothetical protein